MNTSYEAIILGGGKGGKTLAVTLGKRGLKTALIEQSAEMIGGSCINVACIPTKTFIASARAAHDSLVSGRYGVHHGDTTVHWQEVRARVESVVREMRAMNEKNFLAPPALDFTLGTGRFAGPEVIEVTTAAGEIRRLRAPRIFIDTGTRPARPEIEGLASIGALALDSTSIQRLDTLPEHLFVLGGGYIAVEFAQLFRRLGSQVTLVERGPQLLAREDSDVARSLATVLRDEGVDLHLAAQVERVDPDPGSGVALIVRGPETTHHLSGSHLLVALGRTPVTSGLNLAAAGVETDAKGYVRVNERLETTAPGVWAIGDVAGSPQFTHASLDDGRILLANLFDDGNRSTSARLMPSCLFTDPELASIGLTEKEARTLGLDIRVAAVPASAIPRAKTSGHTHGLLKAIVDAKTDRILGCTIFAESAGETISTVLMAMTAGLPYSALHDAVLTHPTMTEGLNLLFGAL